MLTFYPGDILLAAPPTQPQFVYGCFDGTYVWAVNTAAGGRKLCRVRKSDHVIVGTDGVATTYAGANAFYTITVVTGWAPGGIVYSPDMDEIAVPCEEFIWFFDATTFANTGKVSMGAGNYAQDSICSDGTFHYVFTNYNNLGTIRLRRIDPTTHSITDIGQVTGSGFAVPHLVQSVYVGGYIWASDGNRSDKVWKIDPATGAVVQAVVVSSAIASGTCLATDGTYLFVGTGSSRFTTIRLSDGAWMKADKTVGATYTDAQTLTWNASSPTAMACVDGDLLVAVNVTGTGRIERYRVTDLKLGGIFTGFGGNPTYVVLANDELFTLNFLGTGNAEQAHMNWVPVIKAAANLTAVDPGTGPHLSLTFDAEVGITGPTIGPPASRIGVTSVSQVDTTHIDLNLAIAPDAPSGEADYGQLAPPIGEADVLGPPVPTGIGATVI